MSRCGNCGADVVLVPPYGWYDAEGQQGHHFCAPDRRTEIPDQVECWRCLAVIERFPDGRRLDLDGEPHDCRTVARPVEKREPDPEGGVRAQRGLASSQPLGDAESTPPPKAPAPVPRQLSPWLELAE